MNNIDCFNRLALHVLQVLYEDFPRPRGLDSSQLALDVWPEDVDEELDFYQDQIGQETVQFLADEGFLTYAGNALDGNFYEARLTLKGLTILGYSFESQLKDQRPLADRIREAMADGGKKAGKDAIHQLFASVLGAAIQAGSKTLGA